MAYRKNLLCYASLAATGAALLAQGTARAQTDDNGQQSSTKAAPANESQFEEILVTARKRARAEALQTVAISATAFGAEQLKNPTLRDLSDIGRYSPSSSLQPSTQKGVQNFAIRGMGVSGSVPSDEPAVGIFQDGIYWGSNYGALGDLFDIEGLEILRGPQGTLFGRNVTGGAILVRSARPTDNFLLRAQLGAGNYGAMEGGAVLNAPVAGDDVAARVAFQYKSLEGYYRRESTNARYGENETLLVRPSIKFQLGGDIDLTIIGEYYKVTGDPVATRGLGGEGTVNALQGYVVPSDFWTVASDEPGHNRIVTRMLTADFNARLGSGVVSAILGYRDVKTNVLTDYDGTPSPGYLQGIRQDQDQFSAEFRYSADIGDLISFTAGGYYFEQNFDFHETRVLTNPGNLATGGSRVGAHSLLDNNSKALFAEVDLKPVDGITITGGLRYTEEEKTVFGSPFGVCSFDFTICPLTGPRSTSENNLSPKLLISYKPNNDHMIFASWTRGFRSGGFAQRGTPLISPYRPEQVDAFEVGFKGEFIDNHVRFNTSLYYNKYKDLQRNVLATDPVFGTQQSVFNAADANIKGGEFELIGRLGKMTLSGTYSYTDTKYESFLGVVNPARLRFIRVPKDIFSISTIYRQPVRGGDVEMSASFNHTGKYYFDDLNTMYQKAYNVINANVTYTSDDDWSLAIYGNNLSNERYYFWGADLGSFGGKVGWTGSPRTWGVRFSKEFR